MPEPQVGGPVDSTQNLYISRGADRELVELLRAGEYVNVITSRQMGKTSLVYRAMEELSPQGYHFAYYDLSPLKNETDARRYFRTLIVDLARELELDVDLDAFWAASETKASGQAFVDFFRLALDALKGPIVVVLDEIDSTLESAELRFTDDLFTAIRSLYTRRPREAIFKRLTFCLVGVATPNELIKARRTTPYNVGRTLWLEDFDPENVDLTPLARTLSDDPRKAEALLARVLHWTGGQPYLTMWMCDELRREGALDPRAADALVEQRFASLDGLRGDSHFDPTQRFLGERASNGAELLELYERVLRGKREADRPANLAYAHLKLSGLVKRNPNGLLVVRNPIYERLFNLDWVQKSRPRRELRRARRLAYAAAGLLLVALAGGITYYQVRVAPLQKEQEARTALEGLGVTLQTDYRGWTLVGLPASEANKDLESLLRRAAPYLATIGRARDSKGLYLDLSSSAIVDLGAVAEVTGLRRLDLSGTKVTDLEPLARLADLQDLDVSGSGVTTLEPLSGLIQLEALDASETQIESLQPLASLTALQQLWLSHTRVSDLRPFARLARLQALDVSWTAVRDLTPVATLPLRTLGIDGLGITESDIGARFRHVDVRGAAWDGKPARDYETGQVFRDCQQCPEMVVVPAGGFLMRSPEREQGRSSDEGPQQEVTIARPFAVGSYEVQFDEWAACVQDQRCRPTGGSGWGQGVRPVINVSWEDAQGYVSWLAKKTGKPYRLLSEAEWEYVARAGTTAAYPWGDEPGTNLANFRGSGSRWSGRRTAPVGSFDANPFGLHEMIGNVWEWVQDCWNDSYAGAPTDGRAWEGAACGRRVLRGGSWNYDPEFARVASRGGSAPGFRVDGIGFRLARTL